MSLPLTGYSSPSMRTILLQICFGLYSFCVDQGHCFLQGFKLCEEDTKPLDALKRFFETPHL